MVSTGSTGTSSTARERIGPNSAHDRDLVELRVLGKDLSCGELDWSKVVHHELVVARVKAALKEFDQGPSSVGHIGSKVEPRSHAGEPGVASIDEAFSL